MNIIKRNFYAFLDATHELLKNPISNVFSVFIISLTIVIPMLFFLIVQNLDVINNNLLGKSNRVYVYLDSNVDAKEARVIKNKVSKEKLITHIEIISKQQALEDVVQILDFNLGQYIEENPLPIVLELYLNTSLNHLKHSKLKNIIDNIKLTQGVHKVQVDIPWILKINKVIKKLNLVFLGLLILMSLSVVFLIINTIRLSLQDSAKKIQLLTLLGAAKSYIRLPFIYLGLIYGITSGLLALSISYGLWVINYSKIKELSYLLGDGIFLGFLTNEAIIFFLIFNSILGILSTYIAYVFYGRSMVNN